MLALLNVAGQGLVVPSRAGAVRMGLFDGAKKAFEAGAGAGEKPLVGGDRITPFDRWLGLDKEMESETIERVGVQGATFVDPNELTSYFTVALTKPMGIAFVENAGDCKGLVVEEVMDTGSAAASEKSIISGDQLVAVDTTLVLGNDFDTGLGVRPSYLPYPLSYPRPSHDASEGRSAGAWRVRGGDSCARLHATPWPHSHTPHCGHTATQPHSHTATHTATPCACSPPRLREQAIKSSSGDTVKLVFFRGPTNFLYGPTKPDEEWYRSNLL